MNTPEPIHPGEHLQDIIEELGISRYRLAKTIGEPPIRINAIIKRRRSIKADTELRIGRALGTTPDCWLNLKRIYDGGKLSGKWHLADTPYGMQR